VRARWPSMFALVLLSGLPACGYSGGPIDLCPGTCQVGVPTCDLVDAFQWTIRGFDPAQLVCPPSGCRVDGVIEVRVGDTMSPSIEGTNVHNVDCREAITVSHWGFTNSGIVHFAPAQGLQTILTAANPGETAISAELQFRTGQRRPALPYLSGIRITGIRVVPR
jgi:hypothetical protein